MMCLWSHMLKQIQSFKDDDITFHTTTIFRGKFCKEWLIRFHDFMCPDYCCGIQQIVYPKHSSPKSGYVNRYLKNSLQTSKYHSLWKWTVHCMLLSTKEKCVSQISFTAFILHSNMQMCVPLSIKWNL